MQDEKNNEWGRRRAGAEEECDVRSVRKRLPGGVIRGACAPERVERAIHPMRELVAERAFR